MQKQGLKEPGLKPHRLLAQCEQNQGGFLFLPPSVTLDHLEAVGDEEISCRGIRR